MFGIAVGVIVDIGVCSCLLLAFVAGSSIVSLDINAVGASQMLTRDVKGGGRDHAPNASTRITTPPFPSKPDPDRNPDVTPDPNPASGTAYFRFRDT